MAVVERGGYLGVASPQPRRVARRLREGVLGRRRQTQRSIAEEEGRDPVRRDLGRIAEVGRDLYTFGPRGQQVSGVRDRCQDVRLRH